jgi:hypothetical protein
VVIPSGLVVLNLAILFLVVIPVYWPAPGSYRISSEINVPPKIPAGELVQGAEFAQSFQSQCARLSHVQLFLGTYDRVNQESVRFRLVDEETDRVVREQVVVAETIVDQSWYTFSFEPAANSLGKRYILVLNSPASQPGDAITVYRSQLDRYDDGEAYVNGEEIPSDLAFRSSCSY